MIRNSWKITHLPICSGDPIQDYTHPNHCIGGADRLDFDVALLVRNKVFDEGSQTVRSTGVENSGSMKETLVICVGIRASWEIGGLLSLV